jgi:hypothetical protein
MKPSFFVQIVIKFLMLLCTAIASQVMVLYVWVFNEYRRDQDNYLVGITVFFTVLTGFYLIKYCREWKLRPEILFVNGLTFLIIHFIVWHFVPLKGYEKYTQYTGQTITWEGVHDPDDVITERVSKNTVLVTSGCESINELKESGYELDRSFFSLRDAYSSIGYYPETMCIKPLQEPNKLLFGIRLLLERVFYTLVTIIFILIGITLVEYYYLRENKIPKRLKYIEYPVVISTTWDLGSLPQSSVLHKGSKEPVLEIDNLKIRQLMIIGLIATIIIVLVGLTSMARFNTV